MSKNIDVELKNELSVDVVENMSDENVFDVVLKRIWILKLFLLINNNIFRCFSLMLYKNFWVV